jgi:hypothetical protein
MQIQTLFTIYKVSDEDRTQPVTFSDNKEVAEMLLLTNEDCEITEEIVVSNGDIASMYVLKHKNAISSNDMVRINDVSRQLSKRAMDKLTDAEVKALLRDKILQHDPRD